MAATSWPATTIAALDLPLRGSTFSDVMQAGIAVRQREAWAHMIAFGPWRVPPKAAVGHSLALNRYSLPCRSTKWVMRSYR